MKFGFDARFIREDHHDGISRFSSELFAAVVKRIPVTAIISQMHQLNHLPPGTPYVLANDPTNAILELLLPQKLNKKGFTHVFSPLQTMGAMFRKYKLFLTQHDLIYYFHPSAPPALNLFLRLAWRFYHLTFVFGRYALNRADGIVTVSETSKNLILKNRLTKRPVQVVYNAASQPPVSLSEIVFPRTRELIYMGSFMDYKNVETLIAGMNLLPDFELLLLSKISSSRRNELEKLAVRNSAKVRFLDGVSDAEYEELLSRSFALVSASKDEGFGIPIIEAMRHGLPVVVSDLPVFREVAGENASYFQFDSSEQFAAKVWALESESTWKLASRAALARAEFFSWDDSAKALISFIETV